ncbi:MAG: serine hydrolase, partial [Candidatus Omnitrophica bacterium]|nr:serine hydrolase [Candidatus Omnitrophota bacterium]
MFKIQFLPFRTVCFIGLFFLMTAWTAADELSDAVDSLFSRWAKSDSPGCAAAVIRDGAVIYQQGYGMANLEYDIPIMPSSIFHVASISKQFTAFAILLLEDEGKLSVDDDIHDYLPEMHDFGEAIRIHHLIHHTSGLRDQWELARIGGWRMDDVITQQHLLNLIFHQKELNFEPGEKFVYCNSGFTLLAEIVSRVSGQSFPEFCQTRIFEPLAMKDTHFHIDHRRIVPHRTYSYFPSGDGFTNAPLIFANAGATSLFTTAPDMAKWDQNFYEPVVGNLQIIEKMQMKGRLNNGEEIDYASGLGIGKYRGLKTVSHGGADAGYRSIFTRFPDQRFSVVVFSNCSNFDFSLDQKIADIYLNDVMEEKKEEKSEKKEIEKKVVDLDSSEKVDVDPAILNEYAGYYQVYPNFIIQVYWEENKLLAKQTGQSDIFEFIPLSAAKYKIPKINALVTFHRNDQGKVIHAAIINQEGEERTAPKIELFIPPLDQLKKYEGCYYSEELQTAYTISVDEDDQLWIDHPRHTEAILKPIKKHRFTADMKEAGRLEIYFECNAEGVAQGFRINSGNRVVNLRFIKSEISESGEMESLIYYPNPKKDNVVDDFHGTKVSDPYRWMEDPKAEDTVAWVNRQNEITRNYLDAIPAREIIDKELTEKWDYPKYSLPYMEGDRYFFSKNDGLQNQSVLYMQDSLDGEPTVVIDPNTLSEDGTIALSGQFYSKDGNLLAYALSSGGSDWKEIKIRNLETGEDYPETLQWYKFGGVAWKHDQSGFYYSRYPEPGGQKYEAQNRFNKVFWHVLGTPQSEDVLIYERPDEPDFAFSPGISDDGQYLILYVSYADYASNRVYYRRMDSKGPFIRLLDEGDALYEPIESRENLLYFKTDYESPRGRIIAIDAENPGREHWKTIVPEQKDVIAFVSLIHDQFVVGYMRDAHHILTIYNLDGSLEKEIDLPSLGTIAGLSGQPGHTEMYFGFTSFLYPGTQYRYDFTTGETSVFRESEAKFDPSPYETEQVFYASKDGTKIPMFLVHKKGIELDGENPALLYGYGGFDISIMPSFSIMRAIWLEHGGLLAVANLRGGGEYGKEWHHAGMFEKKQNVFDDFISAGEWLVENKYTRPSKLAIQGGSNGGLLTAACMLQRPDLFGAVLCHVP